ncbi:helix-turn-helix transcriptional regulator [Rhizobium sullae]|nr:LuxR family transcriptional regulator [Rhizobium sullae]
MNRILANLMFDFLKACDAAHASIELSGLVAKVVMELGFESFAMAALPLRHERLEGRFLLNGWPREWFERYLRNNYIHRDPVVDLVRQNDKPIIWSKAIDHRGLAPKARQIMKEAAQFGLVDGLTIPLHSTAGLDGVFSVSGPRLDISTEENNLLRIVAASAFARLLDLKGIKNKIRKPVAVTRSESECLAWCVAGKTDLEIGRITGRSQRTVQIHLRNLQQKLQAKNRAQLIAEAFRQGLQR